MTHGLHGNGSTGGSEGRIVTIPGSYGYCQECGMVTRMPVEDDQVKGKMTLAHHDLTGHWITFIESERDIFATLLAIGVINPYKLVFGVLAGTEDLV